MVKFSAMIEQDDASWIEAEAQRRDRPVSYIIREAISRQRRVAATGVAFDTDRVPEPAGEAA